MKKRKLKLHTYEILANAVETGCAFGVRRLWKHRDELDVKDAEAYAEEVAREVMNALVDVVDFGE